MTQIKLVIFDMDGVIVDNHHYHVLAWETFCKNHKIQFNETEFRAMYFGKVNRDILSGLFEKHLTDTQVEVLGEEKEAIYRKIYKLHIEPVKGLVDFLDLLKRNGYKIAVATSAPSSNLDFVLDQLNIRNYFDTIVDASMVNNGKPDPEIYLKAADLLNIEPEHSVVFEDSVSGIQSGFNAGMNVIALLTTHTKEELPKTEIQIKDFTELNFEEFLSRS